MSDPEYYNGPRNGDPTVRYSGGAGSSPWGGSYGPPMPPVRTGEHPAVSIDSDPTDPDGHTMAPTAVTPEYRPPTPDVRRATPEHSRNYGRAARRVGKTLMPLMFLAVASCNVAVWDGTKLHHGDWGWNIGPTNDLQVSVPDVDYWPSDLPGGLGDGDGFDVLPPGTLPRFASTTIQKNQR